MELARLTDLPETYHTMSQTASAPVAHREEVTWEQTLRLLNHGVAPHRITAELIEHKWSETAATEFVELAQEYLRVYRSSAAGVSDRRRRFILDLQIGGLWIGGGILLFLLTKFWPRSEMLIFLAVFAGGYGLYEIIQAQRRRG